MQLTNNIDIKSMQKEANKFTRDLQNVVNKVCDLKLPNEAEVLKLIEAGHELKQKEIIASYTKHD